eukprot:8492421-Pyramimonas_sp.AAC.1
MDPTKTTLVIPAALAASIWFFAPSQSTSSGEAPSGPPPWGRPPVRKGRRRDERCSDESPRSGSMPFKKWRGQVHGVMRLCYDPKSRVPLPWVQ